MVALSPVRLRTPEPVNSRSTSSAASEGGFAQTLATLTGDEGDVPPSPAPRQDTADDGKTLPDPPADPAAAALLDPRLLWLPAGLLPTTPAMVPAPAANTVAAAAVAAPADPLAMLSGSGVATDTKGKDLLDGVANGDAALQSKLADLFSAAGRLTHAGPVVAVAASPSAPSAPPVAGAPVFADLTAALGIDQATRDDRKKAADAIQPTTTMTTEVALQNAVHPTADTRHVPLDLRGDTGVQKMIDHIETLRDDANANETRIRLVPDALGGVDVAVRRSGDAVHVHFTADTEATRTLLAQAQPRLVELADARGVRIAGATVDVGTGNGGGGHQPHQPAAPITNVSTPTSIEATGDDARLA